MTWRVGIDVGGTFTDVAMVHESSGAIEVAKVPTTPSQVEQGVMDGVSNGLEGAKIDPANVSLLSHATTVVTNALLEQRGARAGFVTTRGFRDVLEIRRGSRSDLYDLFQDGPAVLIPRRWRYEVTERVDAQGDVVTPLAEDEVPAIAEAIRAANLDTVAVCFLFSFLNADHERRAGELLQHCLPDLKIYLSCEILPEIREFDRSSTTAVCAYVGPILEGYLRALQNATTKLGLPPLHVMGSSGGVGDVRESLRMPAACIESGPAAGVIAASHVASHLGVSNLISFDMGGTTAKASLVVDGQVPVTAEYEVGGAGHSKRWMNGTGHPIRVPVVDLVEVSAGGGSISWIDPGGAMKVGPQSAGAAPGPACYNRGGTRPTVTDANVVLGYLDPEALLDGALEIDSDAARASIEYHLAEPLGLSVVEAARRIIDVVSANMVEALRMVSVERGHDPREFSLVAFGGAGPLLATALASELEMIEVIIPPAPGAFSALGLVTTDLRRDYSRTLYVELKSIDPDEVQQVFAGMEMSGIAMLEAANVPESRRELVRSADMRYPRQAYELTVPVHRGRTGSVTRESLDALTRSFHLHHEQTYGYANVDEPVQLVNLRVTAVGRRPSLQLKQSSNVAAMRERTRSVWFPDTDVDSCRVLWRPGLRAGEIVDGPTIVESLDSTVVIPPMWSGSVDDDGYIRIRKAERGRSNG